MKQRVALWMQMEVLFLCFLAAIPSRAQVANNAFPSTRKGPQNLGMLAGGRRGLDVGRKLL